VRALPGAAEAPFAGVTLRREMGGPVIAGTRFSAWLGDELIGFADLVADLTHGGTLSRLAGWGGLDSLYIADAYRRRGVATWLIGHAADWLRLGHADRLITYCEPGQADVLAFAAGAGWRELLRTERGWVREAAGAPKPRR
jgi:GNAT superfamily N-acetyltransferase